MNISNINFLWGSLLIEELRRLGVEYFCVAPGSRSAPLTVAAAENKNVKTFMHVDERALAFHALGYVSATKKPAVLICTSGTAGANFLPAVIEASKKKLPLIVMTADRPPELRQTGAMQTIDQVKLFGSYVKHFVDMPCPDEKITPEFVLTTADQAVHQAKSGMPGPVHINCMFREPLDPKNDGSVKKAYLKNLATWQKGNDPFTTYKLANKTFDIHDVQDIQSRLVNIKQGVIVVGKLPDEQSKAFVLALSEALGWPIFPDVVSGLRLGCDHHNVISYYDQLLMSPAKYKVDGVLHLGGRMTSKRYYQWVEAQNLKEYIMVLNHPLRNDPLHNVTLRVQSSVMSFAETLLSLLPRQEPTALLKTLIKANQTFAKKLTAKFKQEKGLSEGRVARIISEEIKQGHGLFLSNSLPVRMMDQFANTNGAGVIVGGNRGASGIDGIMASAAGFCEGLNASTTLVIGDLAALYDLNALAMLKGLSKPLTIVIVNNNGGRIFEKLPIAKQKKVFEAYFATPHGLNFQHAANMFGLKYTSVKSAASFKKSYQNALKSRSSQMIEIT